MTEPKSDFLRVLTARGYVHQCTSFEALDAAADRRVAYWQNRVRPYLQSIWPQTQRTPAVSAHLGRVCIAAHEAFPEALEELRDWLKQPLEAVSSVIYELQKSGICEKFPAEALDFLDLTVRRNRPFCLAECLESIGSQKPALRRDDRFRRLEGLSAG